MAPPLACRDLRDPVDRWAVVALSDAEGASIVVCGAGRGECLGECPLARVLTNGDADTVKSPTVPMSIDCRFEQKAANRSGQVGVVCYVVVLPMCGRSCLKLPPCGPVLFEKC